MGFLRCNRRISRFYVISSAVAVAAAPCVPTRAIAHTEDGPQYEWQKIIASDGVPDDRFGSSVAIDGNIAIVGATRHGHDGGPHTGAGYVLRRQGVIWTEVLELYPTDGNGGDEFGIDVAISGETVVVGSSRNAGTGAAYVYEMNDSEQWEFRQKRLPGDGGGGDRFGTVVAIDGDTILVGAELHAGTGAVYVYMRNGEGVWGLQQKLVGEVGDMFGSAVAVWSDTAVIGSIRWNGGVGRADVYLREGSQWGHWQTLFADDNGGNHPHKFGLPVVIDDSTIAVGAHEQDNEFGGDAGAIYVFDLHNDSWVSTTMLVPSNAQPGTSFAICDIDGNVLIGCGTNHDAAALDSGAAWLYTRDGESWVESHMILPSDGGERDFFGTGRSSFLDLPWAVIGANSNDNQNGNEAGAAYFFFVGPLDTDSDGLTDTDETDIYGTDPDDPDTDDDGLLDGTEVDMAAGTGCPDPLDADSDDDTLLDGAEVTLGTSPCNPDTDGDGVNDATDDMPLEPGVSSGQLEDFTRLLGDVVSALDVSLFNGANNNANQGRRNSLANRATEAANAIAAGDYETAIDLLVSLLAKVDGVEPEPDWMDLSPEQQQLAEDTALLIALLML